METLVKIIGNSPRNSKNTHCKRMKKQQKRRDRKTRTAQKATNNIEREAQDQSACLSLINRHHCTERRELHTHTHRE